MNHTSPDRVLEQLKKQVTPKMQRSLEAIFTICVEQQERGLRDFSYSTIARLGKDRSVPAAQSIRNKTGDHYRTLISSFININPKPEKSLNNAQKGITYSWIDELKDPVVRLQANILYSQKKEAEQLLREVVPINNLIEVFDSDSTHTSSVKLTELERRAFEYILSKEFLRRHQLELGKNGTVLTTDNKETLLPVATLDAIKKALHSL